jgi:SH3 domain protein
MHKLVGLWLMLCLSFSALAQEQSEENQTSASHFISDDLFIFLHAGPGRQYRILGSVTAGTPITKTDSDETNEFVEIIDNEGRTGWIEAEFLTTETSRRQLVAQLQEQTADAQASVAPLRRELSQSQAELADKEAQLQTLNQELAKARQQLIALESTFDNQQHEEQMQYMLHGGAMVAGGLLLGIIITFIPKRRKRRDEWMN